MVDLGDNDPALDAEISSAIHDVQIDALGALWEECCADEPVLAAGDAVGLDLEFARSVLHSLENPQPLNSVPDPDLAATLRDLVQPPRSAGVALRQVMCLAEAIVLELALDSSSPAGVVLSGRVRRLFATLHIQIAARVMTRLDIQSKRDDLTGLLNYRACEIEGTDLVQNANRGSACVAFLDLDGLKAVNDSQGHEQGDEYIRSLVRRLEPLLPEGSKLYRWRSGDEFVVTSDLVENELLGVLSEAQDAEDPPFSGASRFSGV